MLKQLDRVKGKDGIVHGRRSGYSGQQSRDHGEAEAKRILKRGLREAGLRGRELQQLPKRDWRKRAIGRVIRKRTVMPVAWIAEALCMGQPNGVASALRRDPSEESGTNWKRAQKLVKQIESGG